MTVRMISRRQLLLGAGGFSLGLPWLGSLLPREVEAQGAPNARRFVAFATDHGGLLETAMFPNEDMLTDEQKLYSDHTIRRGNLIRSESGGRASVSTILSGASDRLTDRLVERMNVLRGVDIPFYIAHHTGGHLGNYARRDGNKDLQNMPTIDQLLAWSPSFYPDLSGITERSMILGDRGRLSWMWASPSERSGEIQEVASEKNPAAMFQRVFIPEEDPMETAQRPPVVDRVFDSYQSLRQSNRRLSTEDRQRLDDHMDRLAELQRRLNVDTVRPASCGEASAPGSDTSDPVKFHAAINDVIAAAFLCGTSRIAVVKINEYKFVPYAGDWHQDVAHQWASDGPQKLLQEANQKSFEHAVLDLAHKLDVEEAPGQSVLDSTIIQWTQESGEETHESRSAPVVTFGAGGGGLKTGNYCDYRKLDPSGIVNRWSRDIGPSGLFHAQWLAQVMQTLGMSQEEFADIPHNGPAGYGYDLVEDSYKSAISDGVVDNANDPLPFLT